MENNNTTKQITPPYLSVSKIDELVNLVANKNLTEITTANIANYGFKGSDAVLAVNTLKFIGVSNDEGKPTELMSKLRLKGDARKSEFEKIVRQAYKKLFDLVDEPHKLSTDNLSNDFYAQYKITPRIARSAVPAFLKFCEYAGLIEEGIVQMRKRTTKTGVKQVTKSKNLSSPIVGIVHTHTDRPTSGSLSPIKVADGKMILYVPSQLQDKILDDEKVSEDWNSLRGALRNFANKHIPNENSETDTEKE